jgi:hypothetical protein
MRFYERFKDFFPQAESVVYPNHGHYILEDGGEQAWSSIQGFLED